VISLLIVLTFAVLLKTMKYIIIQHTALRHILTKAEFQVTKLDESDDTEDLSEIFVDEDDEFAELEDADEAADNEAE
jgi:hypothetical protein